ncbi:MAG: HAD-IA family hydrolase [Alphaproteobacteria bacterium]|nr:HAD-IA family hydrolase [Alphaproteobacteria bacterium]
MTEFLLVFDLDGTLIDSVPDLTNALNEVLREHGYSPLTRDEVKPMVGDGVPVLLARAFAARGGSSDEAAAVLPHYVKVYEAHSTNLTRPYPGVAETLAALRDAGYRTAICTNKLQQATLTVLKGLGLESLFDDIAGGDRYPVRKPDGGHLLRLIAGMGGDVTRSVMIGDSENDAAAAQNARVPSIMMRYGYARVDPATLGGVMTLDRFDELPAALDRLGFTASA